MYLSQLLPFADKTSLPLSCGFESAIYETA
jgi:hypothetical protein